MITKKHKKLILIIVSAVLTASVLSTGVYFALRSFGSRKPLKVMFTDEIPVAYIGEDYDINEILIPQDGVEYKVKAVYQDYDKFEEKELEIKNMTFCQNELFAVDVIATAVKGRETNTKSVTIPVKTRADAIDDLLITNGLCGWAENGVLKVIDTEPTHLKGENSKSAISTTFKGSDSHNFGTTLFTLANFRFLPLWSAKSWDNAVLTFWVYNPEEEDFEFQLRIIQAELGVDVDWSEETESQVAKAGEWSQIKFSLRKLGITLPVYKDEALIHDDELNIKVRYKGRPDYTSMNNLYSYAMIVDGIDIADASQFPELDTINEKSNETVEQGWENMTLDTGWQGAKTKYVYETKIGEGSTCSLYAEFSGEKALANPFVVLDPEASLAMSKIYSLPDMNGGVLSGYFKFKNAEPKVSVDLVKMLDGEWSVSNAMPMELEPLSDGWYKATVDVSELEFPGDIDSSEIIRIRFTFSGIKEGSAVNIDTVKFEPKSVKKVKESPKKDWINLGLDAGPLMTTVQFNRTEERLKAEGSVKSAKVVSQKDKAGLLSFDTQSGAAAGLIDSLPDFTKGTLHAYIWFGNQSPAASVRIFNKDWCASSEISFSFEDKGDGWYYGSIPANLFKCENNASSKDIIRVQFVIPKGYTVYIDGLMLYPDEKYKIDVNYSDLTTSGILGGTGFKGDCGYGLDRKTTNNSKDSVKIWTNAACGYPSVNIGFLTPIDISAYSNLTFDIKAVDAYKWVGVKLISGDGKGKETASSEVSVDFSSDGWESVSIRLSKFAGVDLKNIIGIKFITNFSDEDNYGRFIPGKTNTYYIDNLAVVIADPPLTPKNPAPTKLDNDLIGGARGFSVSSQIQDVNGFMMVSGDDNGILPDGSNSAFLAWSNTQAGWPNATFMFNTVQDFTGKASINIDTKFVNCHNWIGLQLAQVDDKGNFIFSNEVSVDASLSDWTVNTVPISQFSGIDKTKIAGIRIIFNLNDKLTENTLAQVYIDNVMAIEQDSDLLGTCELSVIGVDYSVQTKVTNNSGSALYMSANRPSGWPITNMQFEKNMNFNNIESINFDIKFINVHDWASVILYDSVGVKIGEVGYDLADMIGGAVKSDWNTFTIKTADFIKAGATSAKLSAVSKIAICVNMEDNISFGAEDGLAKVFIDNVVLNEKEPGAASDYDILGTAFESGNYEFKNSANAAVDMQSEIVKDSGDALKVSATAKSGSGKNPYINIKVDADALPELINAQAIAFDAKFAGTAGVNNSRVKIAFINSSGNTVGTEVTLTGSSPDENGWVNMSKAIADMKLTTAQQRTVKGIRITFVCFTALNTEYGVGNPAYAVIDNLVLVK